MHHSAALSLTLALALCACDSKPVEPGSGPQQNQSEFPIATSSLWEWSSSVATDGSNYLVAIWRGDSTIVNIYPTATLGTVSLVQVSGSGAVTGSPIDIAQTPGDGAGIYFDGTNYVVLYTNGPTATSTVNVQFISKSGARIGNPVSLGSGYLASDIAYGNGTYLFTYIVLGNNSNAGFARTMSASGTLGPEIQIAPEPGGAGGIAFDGSNFAVMYARGGAQTKGVGVKFISPSGQLVKDVPIATSASVFSRTVVAFNGSTYLAAWDEAGNSTTYHVQAFKPDGTLTGSQYSLVVPAGLRMMGVAAIGSNFLVEYCDRTSTPCLTRVQEFNASAAPIGNTVDVLFSDGTRPREATLTQAASGQRVFAALTSNKGATWDVYGRFITVP